MKLPDFFKSPRLNELKQKMGRGPHVFGSYAVDPTALTPEERILLETGEGIEISFDQITVLPDKTLAYKDSRVLLYIRDVHDYGRKQEAPRYHLAHCSTLRWMNSIGRFKQRYVIASETEGTFVLNYIANGKARNERRQLPVCQNCLDGLSFDKFSLGWDPHRRRTFVAAFKPARFFTSYPRSLHAHRPTYTASTAPLDTYPRNFSDISRRVRERANWRCEECRRDFSPEHWRRYLHAHHLNGDRRDNVPANLRSLCIVCHADQPLHHHLKSDPRYAELVSAIASGRFSI